MDAHSAACNAAGGLEANPPKELRNAVERHSCAASLPLVHQWEFVGWGATAISPAKRRRTRCRLLAR